MQYECSPKLAPILPSAWDESILDALGVVPKSLEFVLSRWNAGGADVRGMHVLGTLAHHPALAKAFLTFNAHVSGPSSLSMRVRELVVLRALWLQHCEYEFVQHLMLAQHAGLTDDDVARLQQGPDAAGWSEEDADLLRSVDELNCDARISPSTWARLAKYFNTAQLLDLMFLYGCYATIAVMLNSLEVSLEPGVAPLDPAVRARLHASQADSRK